MEIYLQRPHGKISNQILFRYELLFCLLYLQMQLYYDKDDEEQKMQTWLLLLKRYAKN